MWRIVGVGSVICLGACALVIWTATQSQFTYQHPRSRQAKIVVTKAGAQVVLQPKMAATEAGQPPRFPRIAAGEREHNFGYADPLTEGQHDFAIQNVGTAPLQLKVESTTCDCTIAQAQSDAIPPGGQGKVTLKWTTPPKGPLFSQTATIKTNDPFVKSLQLTVHGGIRSRLTATVEELVASMDPDEPATVQATIYSQQWHNLTIEKLDSKIEGLTWKEQEVDPAELVSLQATGARRIVITVPGDLPNSTDDMLKLTIQPRDEHGDPIALEGKLEALKQFDLPLHVKVKRRLALYGPAIRSTGVIELGETQQGVAKKVKLQIKIRDKEPSLPLEALETTPSFIQAEVQPHAASSTGAAVPGLYDLVITIPADAPACTYLGNAMGQLRIITKHPRIPETPLALRFAVLPN